MKNYWKILAFIMLSHPLIFGQTADVTSGCAELTVNFSAPDAASYYWEFGDGGVSDLQNPEYSYIQSGDFTVRLYDKQNGNQVGDNIIITVYPEIEFVIQADTVEGCVPLTVNFTATVEAHPDIEIDEVIWTFGDGASDSGYEVTHIYKRTDIYDISLKVSTKNDIKCDQPKIFSEYINADGANTGFTTDANFKCEVPAEFLITNNTFNDEGATYLWEFGYNNETSTERDVRSYTYEQPGTYLLSLTTTTPQGCVTSWKKELVVGEPVIDILNDTICPNTEVQLKNETLADEFVWDFSQSDISLSPNSVSTEMSPTVITNSPGAKTVILTAISNEGCMVTDSLILFVEEPNSNFKYDLPINSCLQTFDFSMTAEDTNLTQYRWINRITGPLGVVTTEPTVQLSYTEEERDSYFLNGPDSLSTLLEVTSKYGCIDTTEVLLPIDKPESFFIPDKVIGCAPFEVNFEDFSSSPIAIENRDWDFGDDTTVQLESQDTVVSHTYTRGGIFEVFLTITNENNCSDISREVIIEVIEKDTSSGGEFDPVPPEGTDNETDSLGQSIFCVGDRLTFGGSTEPFYQKVETNEGRFNHCINNTSSQDTFWFPGTFTYSVHLEPYKIYTDSIASSEDITIYGAHSILDYKLDCSTKNRVAFSAAASINANEYQWYIDSIPISQEPELIYDFDKPGDYIIHLETRDTTTVCKAHRVSTTIRIRDVVADYMIAPVLCDNETYILNASNSKDVSENCEQAYKWIFDNQRPISAFTDTVSHTFLKGKQNLSLVVNDVNGCKDTLTREIEVFGIEPDINLDDRICIDADIQLMDLSTSDTLLLDWTWDLGSTSSEEQNPLHRFTADDFDPESEPDTILVKLVVKDAVGCMDSIEKVLRPYKIDTEMTIDYGPFICLCDVINFSAKDYTEQGSYLNFNWDFQQYGRSVSQDTAIQFQDSIDINVLLRYTEEASGCTSTLDTTIFVFNAPIADFESPFDSVQFICFPEQIPFINTSVVDGPVINQWSATNGERSILEDPVIPFDKGEWMVSLIVSSFYGCADTITKTYQLVGPEGNYAIDKSVICPGEDVTFTLIDPSDVNSFTWDLGNGTQIDDTSPLSYTYEPLSGVTSFLPKLIIRSDNEGCEKTFEIPLDLSFVNAEFQDSLSFCQNQLFLNKLYDGASTQTWTINNKEVSNAADFIFDISPGTEELNINLELIDDRGCTVSKNLSLTVEEIKIPENFVPNVFTPNGDTKNPFFNCVFPDNNPGLNIEVSVFKIYNRWGELLYDNYTPQQGWDGSYKGETVPPDVYAYYIEYRVNDCETLSQKGNVTVVR